MSEEGLYIAEKIREVTGKGEKERYTHLKAKFQRIARRDKKAFHSDQYKKIEESSRMGKTGDLFKKIRDTKEIFHAKISTIKDRNGMDLTEAAAAAKGIFLTQGSNPGLPHSLPSEPLKYYQAFKQLQKRQNGCLRRPYKQL